MSSDASAKIWDEAINKRLFELTHSPHSAEAFGGLIAIGARAPTVGVTCLVPSLSNRLPSWSRV